MSTPGVGHDSSVPRSSTRRDRRPRDTGAGEGQLGPREPGDRSYGRQPAAASLLDYAGCPPLFDHRIRVLRPRQHARPEHSEHVATRRHPPEASLTADGETTTGAGRCGPWASRGDRPRRCGRGAAFAGLPRWRRGPEPLRIRRLPKTEGVGFVADEQLEDGTLRDAEVVRDLLEQTQAFRAQTVRGRFFGLTGLWWRHAAQCSAVKPWRQCFSLTMQYKDLYFALHYTTNNDKSRGLGRIFCGLGSRRQGRHGDADPPRAPPLHTRGG